ncbi:hypothetical protein [Nostoc sp. FACHB-280]|uniref:hypothetical protein n=1 Tax=Nostoc sp. FACHB-280 TaxID=2692839 RepID=UPI00168B1C69|nr:hypothetical protein [Nostoc sp. FACHB-280]MBD2498356.1 hypothetical protein [Nostoc sp. FACHB-280]
MLINKIIFRLNSFCLLLIIAFIIYNKIFDISVGGLFLPPAAPPYFGAGMFTLGFQILCSIPPIICAFSFTLLKTLKPNNISNQFLLYSAILTAGYLLNEIYRLHIIFLQFGIPKLVTIFCYAIISSLYGLAFRRQIKSTPYIILIASLVLLFGVDLAKLSLGAR